MADFRPLLQRAIAGLPDNTPEARQAIYARARDALERHLASRDPALDDVERLKEILALEDVIHNLEGDVQLAEKPVESASEPSPEGLSVPDPVPAPIGKPLTEHALESSGAIPSLADLPEPPAPIALKVPERLKLPEARSDLPRRNRKGLLVGVGVLAMLVMGALALSNRAGPDHYRQATTPQSQARAAVDANELNKREGRLAASETPAPARPVATPVPPAQPNQTEPANRAVQSAQAPLVSAPPPLLVASRAFMILEGQGAAPDQFEGQANWSFAADNANRNGPRAVRLDVQFGAAGLKLEGSITLNTDRAIDASHTILLIFEPGERLPAVREMSAIEWRERETVNGATLAGRLAPIQDNVFMIGLDASAGALQRNLDLLRNQKWLVFETRMANGRRGAFLIEKGSSGDKAISDALSAWK